MQNRERMVVTGIFAVLMFGWLGVFLHVSPRFAGSGIGSTFGIAGAVLLLVPLVYTCVKRIEFFRTNTTKYVSLQTWLTIHIYTGIVGALLALVHTGHKFNSTLGIALTATMMLVVVTGYLLRYLTPFVNRDIKEKLLLLQTARGDLDSAWGVLEKSVADRAGLPKVPMLVAGLASVGLWRAPNNPAGRVTMLADGVANLEYSIRTDELLKRWFSRVLSVHIVLSLAMYALLATHVWASIHFGLRWWR